MPAAIIPDHKVRRLAQQGLGNKEIMERLRTEDYIEVTAQALSMFRERHGLPSAQKRYEDLLPWKVRPEHNSLFMAKMLRAEGRLRGGETLPDYVARRHAAWKRRLQASDAVVHYDPETVEGFWLVERRHGIDRDMVRDPTVD